MADIQTLLSCLDVFAGAPDKAALEQANSFLQDFQHSAEAWSTCNVLLSHDDAPLAAQLFAAQTFRMKVTYDLNQVDQAHLMALRDTLITAFKRFEAGPRSILTQLCLAISGLALQLPTWDNPVKTMIDTFGRNPAALLQFLTLLPEEVNSNTRIPITDDEFRERSAKLLTSNIQQVVELLSMYIQASGITPTVQTQVFGCLRSWLVAGELTASALAETPLFASLFEALASDDLFDAAVDVLCEIIHETQEIDDNMPVIELIVPRVMAIKPRLRIDNGDPEKMKGYARIFTEAGETYRLLILQHTETFFPIVEAIGECSAYSDLDIVPITFPFWYRLAQIIGKKPSTSPLFSDAYRTLMGVVIGHLHFPADLTTLSAQEAENFRSFRHVMGDTLKDCCFVLGTNPCLLATYNMITTALSRSPDALSWQEIEAPLFAMRSMGAEIDPEDNDVVPKIMDLIPSLPNHPRVRYAATLIISRYTEWTNKHPNYIQYQLQYISSGFEDVDAEVSGAAGHALKYLCQDCKKHLAEFLPTLHTFLSTTGTKLAQNDRRQVYEAIAYVISGMPMEAGGESLRRFSLDILAQVHQFANKSSPATKQEIEITNDNLENLEIMLHIAGPFGVRLPVACQNSCEDAWLVFDRLLAKHGTNYELAERATRVIRHGLTLFGEASLPVATSAIARMATNFEATGFPSYMWIAGKIIQTFGNEESPAFRSTFREVYEHCTQKVIALLQVKTPRDIPDVLEDYIHLLLELVELAPDVFFQSSAFPLAFRVSMAPLTLVHSDIIFGTLDLFRIMFTHDCLLPGVQQPPKFSIYATAIREVVEKEGFAFVGYLLAGLVGDFPEDSMSSVVSIFRVVSALWAEQLLSWLPPILEQLPTATSPNQAKRQFMTDVTSAINGGQYDKVKYAILTLHRVSRKARDRRRATVLDH